MLAGGWGIGLTGRVRGVLAKLANGVGRSRGKVW